LPEIRRSSAVKLSLAADQTGRFGGAMLFWLKKFIWFWMSPLSVCLVFIVVGLSLTFSRRTRLGRILCLTGVLLLGFFSNHYVSRSLVRSLETQYAAIPEFRAGQPPPPSLAACRYIVVLGGGNGYSPGVPATSELSSSALGRIVEAVRLLRVLPEAKLLVSGPKFDSGPAHAVVLARAAMSLGIDESRILLIDQALDTEDEARMVRERIGNAPLALVTSAWHMPRAMALFYGQGLTPLACPADFITHAIEEPTWNRFLWDARALADCTWAIRERVGYLWISLRGKTRRA
jgi:uncharacterized SAM-binding protein YcdF (DUF218 family)